MDGYRWSPDRPRVLVVACSDGRLQSAVDAWLAAQLGVGDYDRFYVPGGPGAVASFGQSLRWGAARRDLDFLLEAHRVERLVYLFHGAAADGPDEAVCAGYRHRFPGCSRGELSALQARDAGALLRRHAGVERLEVRALRAEVHRDLTVGFTLFPGPKGAEREGSARAG
jgi:hypothetical protein